MAAIERGIVDWSRRLRVVEGPVSFRRKQAVVLIFNREISVQRAKADFAPVIFHFHLSRLRFWILSSPPV